MTPMKTLTNCGSEWRWSVFSHIIEQNTVQSAARKVVCRGSCEGYKHHKTQSLVKKPWSLALLQEGQKDDLHSRATPRVQILCWILMKMSVVWLGQAKSPCPPGAMAGVGRTKETHPLNCCLGMGLPDPASSLTLEGGSHCRDNCCHHCCWHLHHTGW